MSSPPPPPPPPLLHTAQCSGNEPPRRMPKISKTKRLQRKLQDEKQNDRPEKLFDDKPNVLRNSSKSATEPLPKMCNQEVVEGHLVKKNSNETHMKRNSYYILFTFKFVFVCAKDWLAVSTSCALLLETFCWGSASDLCWTRSKLSIRTSRTNIICAPGQI